MRKKNRTKEKSKKSKLFENISDVLAKKEIVGWLSVDAKKVSAKVLNTPLIEHPQFDAKKIIEFYSR
jgi:hypothetical protein